MIFQDRKSAGRLLGEFLRDKIDRELNPVVLGIPRGGVVVAKETAKVLGLPMSVLIVRKLGVPSNPELAFGAIDPDGNTYLDEKTIKYFNLTEEDIKKVAEEELRKIQERREKFLKEEINLAGREAIVVDDGMATGYTVIAGVNYLRRKGAVKIIVAVPVCPSHTLLKVKAYADEVYCYHTSKEPSFAVGMFYQDFRQVEDEEVIRLLEDL